MAGREQPTGRIAGIGASGAVPGPTTPRWSAERRGPGFARDAPRLASVASRPTSATTGSTPPGAPPAPSFRGRVTKRTQRGCKRKARTRPQDCGAGTKKRALFDIVNGNDASGAAPSGAQSRRQQRARVTAEGAPSCVIRAKVPARMRKRRDTAVTTDRRRRRRRASSARSCGQPTAVHVPSGLRQALPRATCGLPSI